MKKTNKKSLKKRGDYDEKNNKKSLKKSTKKLKKIKRKN